MGSNPEMYSWPQGSAKEFDVHEKCKVIFVGPLSAVADDKMIAI